ncbi:hypothetical protein [Xanthobacter sp. ZOL 2024]
MLNVNEAKQNKKRSLTSLAGLFTEKEFHPASVLCNGFVTLTASQAAALIKMCRYEHQKRDLTAGGKEHIRVLADLMKRRQWREKDKIDFALFDGKYIILNGHHRLTAQALANVPIEWTIVVHVCQTAEEVAEFYYTFDTNLRVRSNANILGASDLAALIGVKPTAAEALWRAVPLLISNFDFNGSARDVLFTRVIDRRMEACKAYQREVIAWEDAISGGSLLIKKRLRAQGACAVALTAFRYHPVLADKFWRSVANNDGLSKGDPRHSYVRSLVEYSVKSGDATSTAWPAAICWNAFYAGRDLTAIRPGIQANFRIAGTPIGKKS